MQPSVKKFALLSLVLAGASILTSFVFRSIKKSDSGKPVYYGSLTRSSGVGAGVTCEASDYVDYTICYLSVSGTTGEIGVGTSSHKVGLNSTAELIEPR